MKSQGDVKVPKKRSGLAKRKAETVLIPRREDGDHYYRSGYKIRVKKSVLEEYGRKRRRVAAHLKKHWSHIPFHAERAAQEGEDYWLDLAASCPNL